MVKQDELENLRRTLSTALFTRNQMPTNSSDAGSILSSSTVGRASSYSVEDHTENDFDNRTLVASTLRSGRSGHYDSRQTSATPSSNTSQNTIKTPTVSVYSPPTSPFNDAQSSVPKDLHPLRGWASRSVFSLSLSRNNSSTLTVNTLDNNDSSTGDNSAVACHRLKKKPSSLRFWRRDKD
ncbi:hypothetical protein BZA77DRAFT_318899 [Pyronema omphalodes]|nr:hypothetical protein BZA77DRAFT_318899 [Pyronema omphalodes]